MKEFMLVVRIDKKSFTKYFGDLGQLKKYMGKNENYINNNKLYQYTNGRYIRACIFNGFVINKDDCNKIIAKLYDTDN